MPETAESPVRIHVAYTGGTFGMVAGESGWEPGAGIAADIARLGSAGLPRATPRARLCVREYSPVIDSADVTPAAWWRLAADVAANCEEFDGFVVIHGTDTMSFTASALSFVLRGLGKPVVLTGAQIPLGQPGSDAEANLCGAVETAANAAVREVCIYFGGRLLRGNRSTKVSAQALDAFRSPNYPDLGAADAADRRVEVRTEHLLVHHEHTAFAAPSVDAPDVRVVDVFPGMTDTYLAAALNASPGGVVLRCYGSGTGPVAQASTLRVLSDAAERGVVLVAVSQCASGGVELRKYVPGVRLADAAVVDGGDMTTEAAFAKLAYLLGCGLGPAEVRASMSVALAGEFSG
jgi:L-asparaginase